MSDVKYPDDSHIKHAEVLLGRAGETADTFKQASYAFQALVHCVVHFARSDHAMNVAAAERAANQE